MEQLEAIVDSTVYRNEENGYSVVIVQAGRQERTVVGNLPELVQGEQVVFTGQWVEHSQYGRQFKASSFQLLQPTTLLGITRFLASGAIRGVGMKTARQIVNAFGEETLTVLAEHPERLQELPGMGTRRWQMIAESYAEQRQAREAMIFLQQYGVPPSLAVKISKQYGEHTAQILRENPYRLCDDLEGVGFLTADRIGMSIGIPRESEYRIQSGIKYILRDAAAGAGHIYLTEDELIRQASMMLRIAPEEIERQIAMLAFRHDLVRNSSEDQEIRVYLPAFDSAERETAMRLCELMTALAPVKSEGAMKRIHVFESKHGITFSDQQRSAIVSALENGVLVITGGPGTGKTTIINCMIDLLSDESQVVLCAPTGRAAKRMSEATGYESRTIHRLLEYTGEEGRFARNPENPIEADCVIVDEMSMVDLMLMRSLLRALEPGTRLILVGDADQLPSVGAGNVLGDILSSGIIPAVCLTDIYRQSETSRIVVNAHRVNHGEMPLLNEKGTDFFFESKTGYSAAAQTIVELMAHRLPAYLGYERDQVVRSIQVLSPGKKGECGVQSLNAMLQDRLNPPAPGKPGLQHGDTIFRVGDKVMQIKNDYQIEWRRRTRAGWQDGQGVFNGDIGFVTDVDEEEHLVTVCFDEDREVVYEAQALDQIELAYCLSVHKSQGSEFPVVILCVAGGSPMLLTRNLFYTALTRARSMVVLVGREEVIARMVANDHIMRRNTTLSERLRITATMLPEAVGP